LRGTLGSGPRCYISNLLDKRDILPITVLAALAFCVSLAIMLHAPWPQHWDATGYAIRSLEMVQALFDEGPIAYLRRFPASHGPILPILNTVFMAITPASISPFWPMAWVQILALVVAVTAGYAALRQYAAIGTATIAMLIYILEPMQLKWATEVMHEGPGFAVIAIWLLCVAVDTRVKTPLSFGAAALATGLVTLSRLNFAVPALAGFGLYGLTRLWRAPASDRRRLFLMALVPLLLTTAVWHVGTGFHAFRYYQSFAAMDSSLQLYWQGQSHSWLGMQMEFLRHVVNYWGTPIVALVMVGAVLAVVGLTRRLPGRFIAPSVFLLTIVALLIVSSGRQERYLAPTLLPTLVLISWAAHDEFWASGLRKALRVMLMVALACQGLLWLERAHVPFPAPLSVALRADSGPPPALKGSSNVPRYLMERMERNASTKNARVLVLGNSEEVNWPYLQYWTLATRSPLRWSSAWDPLEPRKLPKTFEARLADADYFLFAPGTADGGRLFHEGAQFAEGVVARWKDEGRLRVLFEEPRYHVKVYAIAHQAPSASSR
jgi:hypothetical protein